jgi:hypothetical protein
LVVGDVALKEFALAGGGDRAKADPKEELELRRHSALDQFLIDY